MIIRREFEITATDCDLAHIVVKASVDRKDLDVEQATQLFDLIHTYQTHIFAERELLVAGSSVPQLTGSYTTNSGGSAAYSAVVAR